MAGPLRMPSLDTLPRGPHREFVQELFTLYGDAGRPPLERISEQARETEAAGTASKETVRRILRAETFSRWDNVECLFLALCELAGRDPDAWMEVGNFEPAISHREYLRSLWNRALDEPPSQTPTPSDDDLPPF